ncbi:nidogen-1-like [Ruditapes philippinarum]|uniref:nidogen-1-like n=1 Tax=Ruditapes philippinarum TaxID=129788 RepID=UPI00295B8278|nr:nidogen-1-like [Ruditapes philippinarum]
MTPNLSEALVILVLFYAVTGIDAATFFTHDGGATSVTIGDDISERVTLSPAITIKGTQFTEIFISENGMVTTEDGFYGGLSFPYAKPWIAPFGADIIPAGGTMEYQQFTSTDTAQMEYATQLVNEVYKDAAFTAVNALVVTWTDVKIDSGSKANTFQLALVSDASRLYAIFLYDKLEFLPEKIGASAGDDATFYTVCYSDKQSHLQFLDRMSNSQCGTGGILVFQLDGSTWNGAEYVCSHVYTPACRNRPGPPEANYDVRCPTA